MLQYKNSPKKIYIDTKKYGLHYDTRVVLRSVCVRCGCRRLPSLTVLLCAFATSCSSALTVPPLSAPPLKGGCGGKHACSLARMIFSASTRLQSRAVDGGDRVDVDSDRGLFTLLLILISLLFVSNTFRTLLLSPIIVAKLWHSILHA